MKTKSYHVWLEWDVKDLSMMRIDDFTDCKPYWDDFGTTVKLPIEDVLKCLRQPDLEIWKYNVTKDTTIKWYLNGVALESGDDCIAYKGVTAAKKALPRIRVAMRKYADELEKEGYLNE